MTTQISRLLALVATSILLFSCSETLRQPEGKTAESLKVAEMIIDAATQQEIGNNEQAEKIYQDILSLQPDNSLAYYRLAALSFENYDVERAIQYNEKAVKLSPKNHWYRLQLSEIYLFMRQPLLAAEQYEILVKQYPQIDEYYELLSEAYIAAGEYKKAVGAIERLEKQHGTSESTGMIKYRIYSMGGQNDKAIKEIEKLSKLYPQNTDYLSILAQTAMTSSDYDKAFAYYKKIEEVSPDDENNIVALIDYYNKTNRPQQTEEYIDKMCKNQSMDFNTKNMVMLSVYGDKVDGDPETFSKYISHLEAMKQLHSQQAEMWQYLCIGYMRILLFERAADAAQRSIALGNNDYSTYQNLLFAQSTFASPDSIIASANQAIEQFPSQPIPYLFKGVNLMAKEDYEGAIETFTSGLKRSGSDKALREDFYLNLADSYHAVGRREEAFATYDKVLNLNPDNIPALNNYAYYLSLAERDLDKAEKMAQKVYASNKDNITYADTYAWVLYVAGKYAEALKVFETTDVPQDQWSDTVLQHYQAIKQKAER